MTIQEALDSARETLRSAGVHSFNLDSLILAELATGMDRAHLLAHPENELSDIQQSKFEIMVGERAKRIPTAHITQQKEFYGLRFKVSADVLAPRPESEKIVEFAIKYAPKDSRLLDVGTGCGALAIAAVKNRPDITATATEYSDEAMRVAEENIKSHGVSIELIKSDVLDDVTGKFHTVIANLPYLKDDEDLEPEVQKEPQVALLGGPDGLDLYRKFFNQLPSHLESGGYVFIESDPWQQPDLIKIAGSAGLKVLEQDYFVLGFTLPL